MSLSLTTSWTATETEIINRAARIIGQTNINANEYANFRFALNGIIKELVNEGSSLWKTEWVIGDLPVMDVVTGTDGNNYNCIKPFTSTADSMPISGSDWQDYFVLGGSDGEAFAIGESYTSPVEYTFTTDDIVDVEKVFIRDNGTDYPISKIDIRTYFDIENKYVSDTVPKNFALTRTLSYYTLFLYPVPSGFSSTAKIHSLVLKYYYDTSATSNNMDFPVEYINFLTYTLASYMSDEFHVGLSERGYLQNKAEYFKSKALGRRLDNETGLPGLWRW